MDIKDLSCDCLKPLYFKLIMILSENIAFPISEKQFKKAFQYALKYAIISLPWTINRMNYKHDKEGIEKRLRNIILGKMPEYFMWDVFQVYNIRVEPWAGETGFWEKDRFDMLVYLNGNREEWDIKSLTLDFSKVKNEDWLKLPALIPDRHKNDQWAKRNKLFLEQSKCKRALFTFLENPGLNVHVSDQQVTAYEEIEKHKKYYIHQEKIILKKIGIVKCDSVKTGPRLVISGIAGPDEWDYFKPVQKGEIFLNGLIKTRIKNMGTEIGNLPSFLKITGRKKLHSDILSEG